MPSSTFFRLPEEKRQRLLDAAREEFCAAPFDEVSINRIIRNAHIPRGSFYQYFSDKTDLFQYLLGDMRHYFFQNLMQILEETKGDLFEVPLRAFDRFLDQSGQADPVLRECIQMMQMNKGMGTGCLLSEETMLLPDVICEKMDLSGLRRTDRSFVSHVFFLTIMALTHTIMATIQMPQLRSGQRSILTDQLEIIRYGSVKPSPEEVSGGQGGYEC